MSEDQEWAAYFYPGTDIFINKLGIHDDRLWEAERFLVSRRTEQLYAGVADIQRTFDLEHLKAIHRFLAQDVYDWAGQLRTVQLGKRIEEGEPSRWFVAPTAIEKWVGAVTELSRELDWPSMGRETFVKEIANLHTALNFGHPWRELNGRATRVYLHHVAEQTPFQLDFDRVEPDEWNAASRDSIHPGRERPAGGPLNYEPGERVFEKIVVARAYTAALGEGSAARFAQLDFPTSPTLATAGAAYASGYRPPPVDRGKGTSLER